jgi:hypothetical protein
MSAGEAIRNRTRIQSIKLATGKFQDWVVLGRIEIEYVSDKRSWSEAYGSSVTVAQPKISLEEGQVPVRLEVKAGTYVDWVRIHLSDKRSTEAGGAGGVYVDWSVPKDHFVLAIGGRSGSVIDQLQIYYAGLKPAKMVK